MSMFFEAREFHYYGGPRDGLQCILGVQFLRDGLIELVIVTDTAIHLYQSVRPEYLLGPGDPIQVFHQPHLTKPRSTTADRT